MTCYQTGRLFKRHTWGVCVSRSKSEGIPDLKPQKTDRKGVGKLRKTNHTHTPPMYVS